MNRQQSGAALAISLIILLIMTIIIISGAQNIALQEKMAASTRDGMTSFEAAETAIKEAEDKIELLVSTSSFSDTGVGGLYKKDFGPSDISDKSIWESSITIAGTQSTQGATATYYIEDLGILPVPEEDLSGINMTGYGQTTGGGDVTIFKIVSRSLGVSGNAERILISMHGKRL